MAVMDSPHGGSRHERTRILGRCWGWRWWQGGSAAPNTSCLVHMVSHLPHSPDPSRHPALRDHPCGAHCRIKIILFTCDFSAVPSCEDLPGLVIFWVHSSTVSPAVQVSVVMLDGQAGDLSLQFAKSRSFCQIGAKQQTTQNVSDIGKQEKRQQ